MKKFTKFIGLILALVLSCSTMTGCFVKYDKEKDFMQVAATVKSYEITNPNDSTQKYTTEKYDLYKWQVANLVNQYYQYLIGGYELDEIMKDTVLTQRVLINAAYAYKDFGLIRWSQYEEDAITSYKFEALDSYIEEQIENIYNDRGENYIPDSSEEEEEGGSTTYPVYSDDSRTGYYALSVDQLIIECVERGILAEPANEDELSQYKSEYSKYMLIKLISDDLKSSIAYNKDSDEDIKAELKDEDKAGKTDADLTGKTRYELIGMLDDYYFNAKQSRNFTLDKTRIPGIAGTDSQLSLETTAVERTVTYLKDLLSESINISSSDAQKLSDAWVKVDEARRDGGVSAVYETLGTSFIMEYLIGSSYREQILINLLQEYIQATVKVSDDEIEERYATMLSEQRLAYNNDTTAYESAMSANETVVYHPEFNGYYIKHILIPFSEEQTELLNNYTGSGVYAQYDNKEEYRDYLATQIVGYEHIDGEDAEEGKSLDEIYNEIVKVVTEASSKNKDKEFSKLVYKYSTDPGSIELRYGYKEVIEGTSSYVPEFAEACKELYENGKIGAISGKVVTDYGVHIIMLTGLNNGERIVGLDGYASASDNLTVREYIEDELYQNKYNKIYNDWVVANIINAYNANVEVYNAIFENIMEEMMAD